MMARKPTYEELQQRVKELEKGPDEKARLVDRLQLLAIGQSSEGIAVVDLDGNLEYLNDAFSMMHDYSPEELIGKNLSIFHSPEQLPSVDAANRQVKETGSFKGEVWHVRRDGTEFPTLMHNSLIRDEEGKPIAMVGMLRDISDIRQAEEALQENMEKYRGLIEGLDEAIYRMSLPDGKYEYMSPAARKVFGYSAEEFIENPLLIRKLIHPDFVEYFEEKWADLIEGKVPPTYKYKILDPEGNERWIVQSNTGIFDDSGNMIAIEGLSRDITKGVRAEEALRESEQRLLKAQKVARMGFLGWNLKTNEMYWSDEIYNLYGINRQHEKSNIDRTMELVHPDDLAFVEKHLDMAIQGVKEYDIDHRKLRPDGKTIWVHAQAELARDAEGNPESLIGTVVDITDRKLAEEALRVSEEKYRSLITNIPDVTWTTDHEFKTIFVSPNAENVFGYTPEEIYEGVNNIFPERIHPEDAGKVKEAFKKLFEERTMFDVEYRIKRKDGEWIWAHDRSVSIYERNGVMYADGLFSNITNRKQGEEAIRESEEKLRTITDSAVDSIFCKDINRRYTFVNPAMLRVLGCTKADLIGKVPEEVFNKEDAAIVAEIDESTLNGENVSEVRSLSVAGKRNTFHTIQVPLHDSDGNITGISGIVRDTTDLEQTREALRERTHDLGERIKELNCLYGISNLVEKPDISLEEIFQSLVCLIPPSWQYPEITCSRIILEDKEYKTENFEETNWKQSNEIFVTGKRIGVLEICYLEEKPEIDEGPFLKEEKNLIGAITERLGRIIERIQAREEKERIETQLQQVTKMEAIATLAGGVAHEFNNSLMGIMGHIELLKMNLPEDEGRNKSLHAMNTAGHRMSRLTDQLLAYAQGGKYQPKDLKLDDFVIETLPILQHDLSPEIRVETHFQKDIWHVDADNAQMQMVLSAILTNSNEAIEDEGTIRITAENKDVDDDFTKQYPGLKPGLYVCLTVEDDGKGMDEETIKGIFEPFFTTKFQGRGMGMAAVYGIVMNHDGWISVDSELGRGTKARIYLPATEVAVEKPKKAKPEVATGSGTILMIEGEDVVIEVTQAMLEMLGYRVMVAKTGKDAIHIAETFDGQIDLALLDIKLPDIDGRNLYPLIMKARPNLKVVVFSGYSIDGPAREILDAGAQDFIQKPFSIATLSEKLKEVLEGKQTIESVDFFENPNATLPILQLLQGIFEKSQDLISHS